MIKPFYPPHINKYGITASVGRETKNTTLSLGVNYSWGQGDYIGLSLSQGRLTREIVTAKESYLYVFLASSYLF